MHSITVYTKPGCMKCKMTTRLLDKRGIDYRLIDVYEDADALAHVKNDLGYLTMPVVETPTDHWCDFRETKIKSLRA